MAGKRGKQETSGVVTDFALGVPETTERGLSETKSYVGCSDLGHTNVMLRNEATWLPDFSANYLLSWLLCAHLSSGARTS